MADTTSGSSPPRTSASSSSRSKVPRPTSPPGSRTPARPSSARPTDPSSRSWSSPTRELPAGMDRPTAWKGAHRADGSSPLVGIHWATRTCGSAGAAPCAPFGSPWFGG